MPVPTKQSIRRKKLTDCSSIHKYCDTNKYKENVENVTHKGHKQNKCIGNEENRELLAL